MGLTGQTWRLPLNTKSITTVLLVVAFDRAWSMYKAGQNAERTPSNLIARLWERLGDTGYALAEFIGRLAERWDIDISSYMMDRAYVD